jgi:3-isopropylmalate/(R)-2-methylmalate dehydratase large subunit
MRCARLILVYELMNMSAPATPPQTLAQKLLARAAGQASVRVGEIVNCAVDLAMFHDSSGPRRLKPMLEELGAEVWDKQKVVLVMDHYVPEQDDDARKIVRIARDWAREQDLPHVYDSQGICHVVLPQMGHLKPGLFCVGGDSHSCTGGAFGSYMFGIGSTEMLGVVVTGELWVQVPQTLRMRWSGALQTGVCAKDMMLRMTRQFGMNGGAYQAVEFTGSTLAGLGMAERMTLSNMSAELGAQVGLIAPDETTQQWLSQLERPVSVSAADLAHWQTDEGAQTIDHDFDASELSPMVAVPHSPANSFAVEEVDADVVHLAYIGACTGAKLEDMQAAAQVLKGRRVAPGTSLVVAPASVRDLKLAQADGTAGILQAAGASFLPSTCGACSGYGNAVQGRVNVMATTARNFKGRMGDPDAQVFLASPYTVAASAVMGRISDPRGFLA